MNPHPTYPSRTGRSPALVSAMFLLRSLPGQSDRRPLRRGARGNLSRARRPLGMEGAFAVDPLVGVGAEVVALGLDQVRGEALAAVHVVVAEGVAHRQAGDAGGD